MRRILVVYHLLHKSDRNTIDEHLYSFRRYSDADVWYYNAVARVPFGLLNVNFDLVVFHYTYMSVRWSGEKAFRRLMARTKALTQIQAAKIAFPQDEYVHSAIMCEFFNEFKIDYVFTCFDEPDRRKAYPDEVCPSTKFIKTFTGYVDNRAMTQMSNFWKPHAERRFDIGYRARHLPFWLGRHGTLKWRITEEVLRAAPQYGLNVDASNSPKDVFLGSDWYRFLSDCRVVLGCEGGASLHDPHGKLKAAVEKFVAGHPGASFDEVEQACFPGQDYSLHLMTLSPRHFEATLTKTCQALIEGRYERIFQPDIHYIPIRQDFSNMDEVFKKISDKKYCEAMADRAYEQIAKGGKFTYQEFVRDVLGKVQSGGVDTAIISKKCQASRLFLKLNHGIWLPYARVVNRVRWLGYRAFQLLFRSES